MAIESIDVRLAANKLLPYLDDANTVTIGARHLKINLSHDVLLSVGYIDANSGFIDRASLNFAINVLRAQRSIGDK